MVHGFKATKGERTVVVAVERADRIGAEARASVNAPASDPAFPAEVRRELERAALWMFGETVVPVSVELENGWTVSRGW